MAVCSYTAHHSRRRKYNHVLEAFLFRVLWNPVGDGLNHVAVLPQVIGRDDHVSRHSAGNGICSGCVVIWRYPQWADWTSSW